MHIKFIFLVFAVLAMSACRGGYAVEPTHPRNHDIPELISFNIVDSYLINSEFEFGPYAITPFLDNGVFELFWQVNTRDRYRAELYLNDRDYPSFGILLSSAWCGAGEFCGNESYQYCQYDEDLTMACELPQSLEIFADRDISALFNGIPEDLYFILEVCDSNLLYCEYQSLPVSLE